MKQKGGFKMKGRYRFIKKNSKTGEVISTSEWIDNLIMLDDGIGLNLFIRRLAGNLTYDCIVTSAEIGTGSTAPTDADTDLETPVVTDINVALQSFTNDTATLSFFITDTELANGTYNEFLLRCGTQAFSRSIISPAYTKGSNEDTSVEYEITGAN